MKREHHTIVQLKKKLIDMLTALRVSSERFNQLMLLRDGTVIGSEEHKSADMRASYAVIGVRHLRDECLRLSKALQQAARNGRSI